MRVRSGSSLPQELARKMSVDWSTSTATSPNGPYGARYRSVSINSAARSNAPSGLHSDLQYSKRGRLPTARNRTESIFDGPAVPLKQASPGKEFDIEDEVSVTCRHWMDSKCRGLKSTASIKTEMQREFDSYRGNNDATPKNNDASGEKTPAAAVATKEDRGKVFRDGGFTNEDVSRVFYDYIKLIPTEQLDIMTNLKLDKTCGLKNVDETETKEKQFWFVYLIFSVVFNMASLTIMNWGIFHTYARGMEKTLANLHSGDTVFATLMNLEDNMSKTERQVSRSAIENSYLNATIGSRVHDMHTQQIFLNIAAIVGSGEILGLICLTIMSLLHVITFLCDNSEYRRYMAIYKLMQRRLPEFSTFSSLRLIHKVHPTLLYLELFNHMTHSSCTTALGRIVTGVWFLSYRIGLGTMGLCALAVKILAVGLILLNRKVSVILKLGGLISLMVQCMACIHMEHVLQDRIMLLVFGGQDACYSDDELAYKNVFQARLAKEIWQIYRYGKRRKRESKSESFSKDDFTHSLYNIEEDELLLKKDEEEGCLRTDGDGRLKCFFANIRAIYTALVILTTFDHYDLQWILVQGAVDVGDASRAWVNEDGSQVYFRAEDQEYYCALPDKESGMKLVCGSSANISFTGLAKSRGFSVSDHIQTEYWYCKACRKFKKKALLREHLEDRTLAQLLKLVDRHRGDNIEDAEVDEAINVGDDIDAPTKKSLIEFMLRKHGSVEELELIKDSPRKDTYMMVMPSDHSRVEDKPFQRETSPFSLASSGHGSLTEASQDKTSIVEPPPEEIPEVNESYMGNHIGPTPHRDDLVMAPVYQKLEKIDECDMREVNSDAFEVQSGGTLSRLEDRRSMCSLPSNESDRSTGMNAISRAFRGSSYHPLTEHHREWADGDVE